MPYTVMVDDNFHYMDEDERCRFGEFASAEVAIGHCRRALGLDRIVSLGQAY